VSSRLSGDVFVDYLGQRPSQVYGVLHASVEALAALRWMHMGGVTREQHSAVAVGAACRVMSVNREIQVGLCTTIMTRRGTAQDVENPLASSAWQRGLFKSI
jgi:hypothetical protein